MSILATNKPDRANTKDRACGLCGRVRRRTIGGRPVSDYCRDCKKPARELGWLDEGEA